MKKATTISLSLIAVATTTGVLLYRARRRRQQRIRQAIANEGYETAPDILYPQHRRGGDEVYGPILP
jgi:hypothetical protein